MSNTPPPGSRKILVVDDNHIVVKAVSLKLEAAGYEVCAALDGAEAMAQVRKENPDLILLDLNFPPDVTSVQWDGFRIMEWLHRLDSAKKIPIIVITSAEDGKTKERAMAMGAMALFLKPLEHADLLRVIAETLAAQK
jgi:two-component system chemotaxis sensor kinase CheA